MPKKMMVQLRFENSLDSGGNGRAIFVEVSNMDKQKIDKRMQFFPSSVAKFSEVQPQNSTDVEVEKWFAEKELLMGFAIAEWEVK